QLAAQRDSIARIELLQLRLVPPLKVVNFVFFIPFAFGVPHHPRFDPLDFAGHRAPDPRVGGQRASQAVARVAATERDAQRGRRIGGPAGGWTTTGKLWQNDGHGRASPLTVIFQQTALWAL